MNLLAQSWGRTALFTWLYFSEGAPIGFIWWALPTLLRTEGAAVEQITSLSALLVLPWTLKVLWAPLIDSMRGARWGFRSWIITAQIAMGLALVPLIWLDPMTHFSWWRGLLLAHALAAATQDVAVDALAIHLVPEERRGMLNGCMQAGMLLGRSLFGGLALLAAHRIGWSWVLVALVGSVWAVALVLAMIREPVDLIRSPARGADFVKQGREVLCRKTTWLGLGFALVTGAGFEATGAMAGPYLIDRGVSPETVGWFYGLPVVAATLVGGLLGGRWADRRGSRRIVVMSTLGWVGCIGVLAALDLQLPPHSNAGQLLGLLTGMYFFVGMFTAASYALFMNLTEPALGATQFSAFMSATNGCESWSAWAGGRLAAGSGYAGSFSVMSVISLLGLAFLIPIQRSDQRRAESRPD